MVNEATEQYDAIGRSMPDSRPGVMFGVPCYEVGRRPYIMLYEKQLVCKLFGEAHAEALALPGASLFNPRGNARPMGNWVQLPFAQAEHWKRFARLAFEFVQSGK